MLVTRFAPSPTGMMHIGHARTALYAWLWAKKNQGKFILRIEDTDQTRFVPEAEQVIKDGLTWLGLNWDEGPYRQSERTEIYLEHAKKLVDIDKAYYCFCTPEILSQMRAEQAEKKIAPKYDRRCRNLSASEITQKINAGEKYVIRLKLPEAGIVEYTDLVKGHVKFDYKDIDDQVLIKSDGFPTYHLANVVDDHLMGVNSVIRGEDWLPSMPKHLFLYDAFGWDKPEFGHLPLFMSREGGKMSKRKGAASILNFRDLGYLPEAVINFVVLLGWNPKDEREFFSLEQLINEFDLKKINKANAICDLEKLDYFNSYYLRQKSLDDFYQLCLPYLKQQIQSPLLTDEAYVKRVIKLEQERIKTLSEIGEYTKYFFAETLHYDPSLLIWKNLSKESIKDNLQLLISKLQLINADAWTKKELEALIIPWIKAQGKNNGDVLWPMRAALTGEKFSPSPFEVADVLGNKRSIARLQAAVDLL